jgi:GNAT superfamily N-acetyltransferase
MAVKAANLRVAQAAHPEKKRIVTTNSEVNAPMVAINELMGFKPVELLAEFQIKFDDVQAGDMDIRRVDPDDVAMMSAYASITIASESFENDHAVPFTLEEQREALCNHTSTVHLDGYLGVEAERPVASGSVELSLSDNKDKAFVDVHVSPPMRRRGYGSKMATYVLEQAQAAGRSTVVTAMTYPFTAREFRPGTTFATRHGYSLSQVDVHRILRLPVDEALLDRLADDAADHHTAYTLTDFIGLPPEAMRPDYCVLLNQILTDAPSGDVIYEEGRLLPEHLLERAAVLDATGRTVYTTVALDVDGAPVAHNVLVVPRHGEKIFNSDTMVLRSHRGHRLGMATKIRNLRCATSAHPERTTLHTWNAESNVPMIAVNEAMGFEPVAYIAVYVRTLTAR